MTTLHNRERVQSMLAFCLLWAWLILLWYWCFCCNRGCCWKSPCLQDISQAFNPPLSHIFKVGGHHIEVYLISSIKVLSLWDHISPVAIRTLLCICRAGRRASSPGVLTKGHEEHLFITSHCEDALLNWDQQALQDRSEDMYLVQFQ